MAERKAKAETPGSSISEVRAKSAVVGTELQPKVASSDPPYEAMAQSKVMEMVSSPTQNSKDQRETG